MEILQDKPLVIKLPTKLCSCLVSLLGLGEEDELQQYKNRSIIVRHNLGPWDL